MTNTFIDIRELDANTLRDISVQSGVNYGKGADSWSIDHSRPISSFPMTTTLAEINALENLRPMWHHKNCAKKNKWEGR